MDAVGLERKARLLYGKRWHTRLGEEVVGKDSRTVRLWAAGGHIPEWVEEKIEAALQERMAAIRAELSTRRSPTRAPRK